MPGLIGLGGETEGHRRHIAIKGSAGHEGHEQQVGQHVLERETYRHHELEGAGTARVVEEGLGHGQVPHPVVHVGKVLEAIEVLVVMTHGVNLGLHVTQLIQ